MKILILISSSFVIAICSSTASADKWVNGYTKMMEPTFKDIAKAVQITIVTTTKARNHMVALNEM